MNTLHGDIRPGTILVHVDGRPMGVIGDVTGVLKRKLCDGGVAASYGAPFEHADHRRDQMALILCIVEVLSGRSWSERRDASGGERAEDTLAVYREYFLESANLPIVTYLQRLTLPEGDGSRPLSESGHGCPAETYHRCFHTPPPSATRCVI